MPRVEGGRNARGRGRGRGARTVGNAPPDLANEFPELSAITRTAEPCGGFVPVPRPQPRPSNSANKPIASRSATIPPTGEAPPVEPASGGDVRKAEGSIISQPTESPKILSPRQDDFDLSTLQACFQAAFQGKPPSVCLRSAVQGRPQGREILLESNMFKISLPKGFVYHYDVEIDSITKMKGEGIPEQKRARCASTLVNRKVLESFARQYKKELGGCLPAYDGRKNMYVRKQLPATVKDKIFTVKISDNDEEREFAVQVKPASVVSFDGVDAMYSNTASKDLFQSAIVAADIILRTGPTLSFVPVGRSFFSTQGGCHSLGGGLEAWSGFYTSVRLGQWKPLVNFDVSTTAFYRSVNLIEYTSEALGDRCLHQGLSDSQRVTLQKQLFGLRVTHTHLHPTRRHRIEGLSHRSANRESFERNGSQITVANYFAEHHRIRLKYPNLPCVVERKGNKVPMELCVIAPGQHCRRKLSEIQTSNMIRKAATDPRTRFAKLVQSAQATQTAAKPYLDEFGMSFDTKPIDVKGRVLEPPRIKYSDSSPPLRPQDGAWRNTRFNRPAPLKRWALVTHGCSNLSTDRMVNELLNQAKNLGMEPCRPQIHNFPYHAKEKDVLATVKRQGDVDISVVVLGRSTNYSRLKTEAETSELCMRTQCVKEFNVMRKFNASFAENLLLKINTKCGGVNWRINPEDRPPRLKQPFMIVGADVNHPAPGDNSTPSVASIVASMDAMPSRYYTTTSVQMKSENKNRVEYIVNLKNMFRECLEAFKMSTGGILPNNIYFYRDGVSEGQLDPVRYHEMCALRNACMEMGSERPKMTFIVVQKRHHVRFKPKFDKDCGGRTRNIPAGTVVDSEVVHPVFLDFYLCSQQGPMGTSVPAHYHVVHDDAEHTLDEIQKLSYFLCHAYARCPKAVSIPAPVYYAHLAAARAKDYIKARIYDGGSSGSTSPGDTARPIDDFALAQRVCQGMKQQMYFV